MRPISPDLLAKLNSNMQTPANNAQPRMSVQVSRARSAVVDSTYWTVETIRTKTDLGDISLAPRRLKPYGRPDRIYEIHVDNGIVKTTIREYPDLLSGGWQHQFDLGPGMAVAVSFDGEWELWRKKWRLKTVEKPWIMWVSDSNILYAQHWDDETTRVELATGVLKVKAIRGWKNFSIEADDQGIVAAYIKLDGSVHYRNYCRQGDGTSTWEAERAFTAFTGVAVNINLYLLNDFRMGFVIQNNANQISIHTSVRNWAGMATPVEKLTAGITDIEFTVIPVEYSVGYENEYISAALTDIWFNVAEPIYPAPIEAENPSKSEVVLVLKFNHEIDYDLTLVKDAFVVKDSLNTVFAITSTEAGVDNSELVFNMANFGSASGDMFIVYDRTLIELDCLNQGSRFAVESFSFEFTPDLAPPVGYENENLTVAITDINFTVTKVDYINAYETENITAGITDISFVVTKVGSNPL